MLRHASQLMALFVLFDHVCSISAHVSLTFPPARKYASDFLSNAQTEGPCGMPRGVERTLLQSGANYAFTWHMPFAHPGGIRIELLDRDYNLVALLAPSRAEQQQTGGYYFANSSDPTTTSRQIQLPKQLECKDCVVRLLRPTDNWPPTTQVGYMFRSCADVDIRQQMSARAACSNRGALNVSLQRCQCDNDNRQPPASGSLCQFEEECISNSDCGAHGRCVLTNALSYPRRQCYCARGYFGLRCEQQQHDITDDNAATTLRDSLLENGDGGETYRRKQVAEDFDIFWRVLQEVGEVEIIARAVTTSWIAIGLRSLATTTACRDFPAIPAEIDVNPSARFAYDNKGIALAADADDAEFESLQRQNEQFPPVYASRRLHPMECADIVWGAAKGTKLSRVRDLYSRDLSTPLDDEFYGGRQSLTAATAFQRNGTTSLIFRRPLDAAHATDVAIDDAPMHVIFARGQPADSSENVALDRRNVSSSNYYRTDELKYHGSDTGQRGFTRINFLA